MNKKGISAVVATVLIILITVAAVTIIWTTVLPIIKEKLPEDVVGADLTIETIGGYTIWDSVNNKACVQVKRGADELELLKIQVIFSIDGDSHVNYFNEDEVPGFNEAKTKCFSLDKKPDSVSIAPISVLGEVSSITATLENIPAGDSEGLPSEKPEFIELIGCGKLALEGGTYVLTQSITGISGTCFTIKNNSITLDFNGYNITGDDLGRYDSGVYSDGYNDTTIKNGYIYNFSYGIYLLNNQNNNITNITANSNSNGIYLDSSSNNNLADITANSNDNYGIYLFLISNNNQLTDIIANLNKYGIRLYSSSNNTLTNITVNLNDNMGIYLYSSSNNNLTNITVNLNKNIGIYLYSSSNNNLTNITANSNDNYGIYLRLGSGHIISDNMACDNGQDFYCLQASSSGTGNTFGRVMNCSNGWPEKDTHYTSC